MSKLKAQAASPDEGRFAARLDQVLASAWRSYRRKLKRCRQELSKPTVHRFRVETRRLLALVNLLDRLLATDAGAEVARRCKPPFKVSGRLRDVQVMLDSVEQHLEAFPELRGFSRDLRRRRNDLERRLARKLGRMRWKPLKRHMRVLRESLRMAARRPGWRDWAQARLWKRMDLAFERVTARRRKAVPADPRTIHRTRVAFKQFRYIVEPLEPLLPGLSGRLLKNLQAHQRLMGDIQDSEMLLTVLDEYAQREVQAGPPLRRFRRRAQREYVRRMRKYLERADDLFGFWPPARVGGRRARR